jgi:hypothetical protein
MISLDRFREIITPLMRVFASLDKEQLDVYFDRLKWGDEGTFRLAVEKLLDTHRFKAFPLIEEFKEAIDHINAGAVAGTEDDYSFLDKHKCPKCEGEGRCLVYLDEHGKEVGWDRRNERTIRIIARFCSCWFGRRIATVQGEHKKRIEAKKHKRWYEPGEDRDADAPF